MNDNLFIGIDVGTGSARAGVFEDNGTMLAAATEPIRMWRPQTDFVFGVAWHAADGTLVAGHNTDLDGYRPVRLEGDGLVSCCYESLQLAPGEYFLDVAIHAREGLSYDYWCQALAIQVTAPNVSAGAWAPPRRWVARGPEWEVPAATGDRVGDVRRDDG